MNRLNSELQRLYCLPGFAASERGLVGPDDRARAVVLGFTRAVDWQLAANLHRAVQDELELSPPAVSIAANGGYRLWFSLEEPVALERASSFLYLLCRKYLVEMPPGHLELWPDARGVSPAEKRALTFPPAFDAAVEKWSAFIEPDLGGMFVEEPGLEMAPSDERQADLLAGIESIPRDAFERALLRLAPSGETAIADASDEAAKNSFADPKAFLLAVMNDPEADLAHRIEAAKALLPWFER